MHRYSLLLMWNHMLSLIHYSCTLGICFVCLFATFQVILITHMYRVHQKSSRSNLKRYIVTVNFGAEIYSKNIT